MMLATPPPAVEIIENKKQDMFDIYKTYGRMHTEVTLIEN